MAELILEILGFTFILLCTVRLIYFVSLKALSYGTKSRAFLVLPCRSEKNCAGQICSALLKLPLFAGTNIQIVAVDCGLSEEEKQICLSVCREYGNVRLCSPSELPQIITEEEND